MAISFSASKLTRKLIEDDTLLTQISTLARMRSNFCSNHIVLPVIDILECD
ncbi:hypothetical protein AMATHDRAFT_69527, partial [Amanita thiersii Skay4041]